MNKIDQKASRFLGKQTHDYDLSYTPDLLVPIERSINREAYKITDSDFVGYDVWHNYECSFQLDSGYPLTLVGKLVIPSDSKFFIESKSMKLYFFSLHMKRFGATIEEAISNYEDLVEKDISEKIQAPVEFKVFKEETIGANPFSNYSNLYLSFKDIDSLKIESQDFNTYKETPDLLEQDIGMDSVSIVFRNFRSNCRVTHQPDFANTFIKILGKNVPTKESLVKYLVSFRNEFHFHEEVTEQIYKVLKDKYNPELLLVCNLFTRRGGIDICPFRCNQDLGLGLGNVTVLTEPTIYQ
jgi:7-cyano-7-deazaguanine reductase